MNRLEKIVLFVTGSSHLMTHTLMIAFPSLFLLIQGEFKVGLDILGFAASASTLLFGLGAMPAGWAEQKLGGRTLVVIYQIGSALSALIIATSQSLAGLVIGLMSLGLFCSIYHPSGLTMISHRVKALTRGMAIHGIFGSSGLALGPIVATSIAALISWRAAYVFFALINLSLAVITFLVVPQRTRENDNPAEYENQTQQTKHTALTYYFLTVVLMGLAFTGFTTFMPTHFAQHTGAILKSVSGNLKAGIFPTLVFMAGIAGQYIGGRMGERYHQPTLLIFIVALNIPFLLLMGFTENISLVLFSVMLGVVHFNLQPIGNSLIAQFTQSKSRGLGYGISFFLSSGAGAISAALGGIIAERFGVAYVFPVMGIFLLPAVFTAVMVRRNA
ncbi:MAG: MFS transporter [Fidelibacterota bacterium]